MKIVQVSDALHSAAGSVAFFILVVHVLGVHCPSYCRFTRSTIRTGKLVKRVYDASSLARLKYMRRKVFLLGGRAFVR